MKFSQHGRYLVRGTSRKAGIYHKGELVQEYNSFTKACKEAEKMDYCGELPWYQIEYTDVRAAREMIKNGGILVFENQGKKVFKALSRDITEIPLDAIFKEKQIKVVFQFSLDLNSVAYSPIIGNPLVAENLIGKIFKFVGENMLEVSAKIKSPKMLFPLDEFDIDLAEELCGKSGHTFRACGFTINF